MLQQIVAASASEIGFQTENEELSRGPYKILSQHANFPDLCESAVEDAADAESRRLDESSADCERNAEETENVADDGNEGERRQQRLNGVEKEDETVEKDRIGKAESFAGLMQPCYEGLAADYVGTRRLLLFRKALAGLDQRQAWTNNGKGYVAYRNYISTLKNGDHTQLASLSNTSGDSGRWAASASPLSIWNSVNDMRNLSFNSHVRTSFSSTASEAEHFRAIRDPGYSFVGMHCIFDKCNASVSVIKFGHLSSDLLAFGAVDGSLFLCNVTEPPSIIHSLKGHSKEVTDFDFSSNNQYIASSSLDKSVRVWDIEQGNCIRVIFGTTPQLCIRFHPVNNNFLLVGNANKEITIINFSTGRILKKLHLESTITAMDTDHTGQFIFAGDYEGCIHSISVSSHTGELVRIHKNNQGVISKSSTTTVQFRTFSLLQHGPVLLACTKDGTISFFSVALEVGGYLSLKCSLKLSPRVRKIRSSFCPLLSLEKGEFIVSGSEDSNVYFYDLTRPKHPCVNKLQGHGSAVLGVCWNHGENFLASSDSDGVVIVWKRANLE